MPGANLSVSKTDSGLSSQKFITKMANIVLISTTAILVRISNLFKMHKYLPSVLVELDNFDRHYSQYKHQDSPWIIGLAGIRQYEQCA